MKKLKNSISNICAVIKSDFRRLSKSVVAVVCVFGVALVPCLYAWFNIFSNWDPYTPDSTKNLKIAVVSEDKGTNFVGVDLNVGNVIIERIKGNSQIDWQFPEDYQTMMEGLNAGEYYAALVVSEDFSENLMSFTDADMERPTITYYDNQKMNAVASRVTDRAQALVRDEINRLFVSTIVDELSRYTSVFNGAGINADSVLESLDDELESIKTDLRSYVSIMDSMSAVTQSASNVTSMTGALLPDILSMLKDSRKTIDSMQDRLSTSKEDVIYAADSIRNTSEELRHTVERLDEAVDGDPAEAGKSYVDWDALYGEGGINPYEGEILDDLYYDVNKQLRESIISFDDILQQTNLDSNLISSMSTLQDSLNNLDLLLAQVQGDVDGQALTLDQYTAVLAGLNDGIKGTRDVMNYMLDMVVNIQSNINDLRSSESFSNILDLLNDDVEGLVEYLSSPSALEVVRVYGIDHNGSGMAPFYTVLSLYASALLAASMLSSHIKRKEEFDGLTGTQSFFGRYFTFFIIGQFTALITVLGNLYYIGIQCYNPFEYWLAASITSLAFTMINYALVFAFNNYGEAFAIVILVIQVAGSGGTYPVQMLPNFFQKLYGIMPFNFAMTAMRETIAGSYMHTYRRCILLLLLVFLIFLVIGLVCGAVFAPMRTKIETSKKKTRIMHGA